MMNISAPPATQRNRVLQTICVLLVALTLAACSDDTPADSADKGDAATVEAQPASFETYNVGLARGFVGHAKARVEPVAQALSQSDSDIICLQEAWLTQNDANKWVSDQIDTLIDKTKGSHPYSYYEITESESSASCSAEEAEPLKTCAYAHCDEVSTDDLAGCVLEFCGDEVTNLPDTCKTCVFGQIGSPLDDILGTCTGEGASAYTYNGHNGLLLLSRHELKNTEFTTLESTIVQRSVLHATAALPELGDIDVYCTHLAANLSDVPYPGDTFAGYKEEQAAQIDAMLSWIDETASTDNIVLMGDMNTGPAKAGLTAEFPNNFKMLANKGYQNPYLDKDAPACTYCGDNTLNNNDANQVIDQVFLGFTTPISIVSAERAYTNPVDIEDENGDTISTNLSDHYGLRVTVSADANPDAN